MWQPPSGPEAPCTLCDFISYFSGGLTTEHPSLYLPIRNIYHCYFHKGTHNLQLTSHFRQALVHISSLIHQNHTRNDFHLTGLREQHILFLPFEGFRLVLHLCVITANVHVTLRLQELFIWLYQHNLLSVKGNHKTVTMMSLFTDLWITNTFQDTHSTHHPSEFLN